MWLVRKVASVVLRWLNRVGVLERFPWLRRVGWAEVVLLVAALVVVLLARGIVALASEVQEGETRHFDKLVVRYFRQSRDPAMPIGPAWVREVGLDVTALGSYSLIVLVAGVIAVFLMLQRHWRMTALVLAATVGGMILSAATKMIIDRDRPDVVPHLREVMTPSFPSGHATLSAVVYLTLGAILAMTVHGRLTRTYCLVVSMLIVVAVGVSRVYLGVHYPTDVLAGWGLGLAWALVCWTVAHYLKHRGLLRRRGEP